MSQITPYVHFMYLYIRASKCLVRPKATASSSFVTVILLEKNKPLTASKGVSELMTGTHPKTVHCLSASSSSFVTNESLPNEQQTIA